MRLFNVWLFALYMPEQALNVVDVIKCVYNLNFMKWKINDCLKSSHPFDTCICCCCCFSFIYACSNGLRWASKSDFSFIGWLFYRFQCKFINSNSEICCFFLTFEKRTECFYQCINLVKRDTLVQTHTHTGGQTKTI